MPESKHALLSASSSHRWLNCNPSARLELEFADSESEAASEGTAAHALCEHKLRKTLKMRSKKPVSRFDCDEMDGCTDGYVEFVMEAIEEAKRDCGDPLVLIEQKLDFSCYVPDGFGTGDCLIVADKRLHVIDFKYGQGVLVDAVENPQMMLYALGALRLFDSIYDIETVSMTIYQPRRENISTWTIPVSDLREWTENTLVPKAALAFKGEGEYIPGSWCTFCRAAVKCRARAEAKLKLAQYEFALPPLLTDAEIEDILTRLDDLTKWANEISAYALDAAVNHGKEWRGFKLIEGRSNRKYTDEAAVIETARSAGYHDVFKKTLIPITDMERLMGRTTFHELLGGLIVKPQGRPTLVPVSDKRPAIHFTDAKLDFKHPLYRLLHDEPNPEMTSFAFRETLMSHLLLWGNAYAQIIRNARGEVIALYPLMPNKMTVDRDQNGRLFYLYQRGSEDPNTLGSDSRVYLASTDVLHIPGLGFDGLIGYSPIAMAKNAIGLAIATEEYGAKFFANGAAPAGVLEHPGTIKDPIRVKESWNAAYQGSANAHKIAVLEEGMKYTAIGIAPEQAQFLETRKFQINEIARIFRVPPHMLADLEKSSFSNIEQQSLEFVKYTLDPWVVRWEQSMCRVLFSESEKPEYFIRFNVDGLLRGDYASRMSGYATARQNGWMSANDIRELENLDRIAPDLGGDLYLINGAMMLLAAPQNRAVVVGGEPAKSSTAVKKLRKNDEHKTDRQEDSS